MKTWKIPVSWTVTAMAEIEADTLAEAIDIAKYNEDVPLPEENYYLEESWLTQSKNSFLEFSSVIKAM